MNDIEYLIVGLGNPGDEYENTRHNVGFLTIDALGKRHAANYWKSEAGALTCPVTIAEKRVLLVKPHTFMNLSGVSVARLARDHQLEPDRIIIIHDDLDIEEGVLRHKTEGGHAGHNGLRSLHAKLGTDRYQRIRCGIGRPPGRMEASDYVLQPLRGERLEDLHITAAHAADMVEELLS
ncbi:MAG: aminoacyl-tRNA hydrolase [Coriobacteriia bacterium]|nr:aminoacyl-tRNA hydrolase [Coriobacteriia bacterium]